MRSLSDTLSRIARLRATSNAWESPESSRLVPLKPGYVNPGALQGWFRLPEPSREAPALVVVLHGCAQTATGYDVGSGWSLLAEASGFAVLFPEQNRGNNANLCFNWFNPADVTRGQGELASIREMIGVMVDEHGIDPDRIYVTGLSAGGAMANALMAVHPEVFAGGGIIAGLPYGVASTIPEAFDRMRGHGLPSAQVLQDKLLNAAGNPTRVPVMSVWHGTADMTVVPANADSIVEQWCALHGVARGSAEEEFLPGGHLHKTWRDPAGRTVIEQYLVKGMAHGTPIAVSSGFGQSAPFMLEAGLSSTLHMAQLWGLVHGIPQATGISAIEPAQAATNSASSRSLQIQKTIEDALRAAGLMN